jgi:hypothetical protein
MTEMVLPDVYIDVRAEGLIVPGRITVGNLGVVGTASKGPIGTAVLLGSYAEAQEQFGTYDAWPSTAAAQRIALTLVRALQLAFANGATTVFAVRVSGRDPNDPTTSAAKRSTYVLKSGTDDCLRLFASSEGTWGDDVTVRVEKATESPEVSEEEHPGSEGQVITLHHKARAGDGPTALADAAACFIGVSAAARRGRPRVPGPVPRGSARTAATPHRCCLQQGGS